MKNEQTYLKFNRERFKVLKVEELKLGVQYIHVEHSLTITQLKDTHFHIFTIRSRYKFESIDEYEDYKRIIKKWASQGVLYVLDEEKLEQEERMRMEGFSPKRKTKKKTKKEIVEENNHNLFK